MKLPKLLLFASMAFYPYSFLYSSEVDFIEKFAYAADRSTVLAELVPGTEDYYFYHGLHYQLTGQEALLKPLLEQWAKRTPDSELLKRITVRWKLSQFEKDPKAVANWLVEELHPDLSHQPKRPDEKRPDLESKLDPNGISSAVFQKICLEDPNQLTVTNVAGLHRLVLGNVPLSEAQDRQLLARLTDPTLPGLVKRVLADLARKESRGFGEFPIYQRLTGAQLEEMAAARPDLMQSEPFVRARLRKLQPSADVSLELDVAERAAWLQRANQFAATLAPKFNSLKAHLLHQQLLHDEMQGKLDEEAFLTYLKLPRRVRTTLRKYQENSTVFRFPVDLNANFSDCTHFAAIGDDEALLRRYLLSILAKRDSFATFSPYVEEWFLKEVMAEAKLTGGLGDAEKWFSYLSPERVQELKARVDLDFAGSNKTLYGIEDEVKLNMWVKNTPELRINVFEINTDNYARLHEEPINTDCDLDGLVASIQQKYSYAEPPLQRVAREFSFPELKGKRGVWIIDFIGNGRSSRALIRKGELAANAIPELGGTKVTVLDEKFQPLPKAAVSLGSQRYVANEKGEVSLPLHEDGGAGQHSIILHDGSGFAQRVKIFRQTESYALEANFSVPPESLLAGHTAQLVVRANLTANPGFPLLLEHLDSPKLILTSTNLEGLQAIKTVEKLSLKTGDLASVPFLVPDRLAKLEVTLSGRVKSRRTGEWLPVSASDNLSLNVPEAQNFSQDLYLAQVQGQYVLRVLGKNGEASPHTPVQIGFHHAFYPRPLYITLGTDEQGAIALGALTDIAKLETNTPSEPKRFFDLPTSGALLPQQIHLAEGEPLLLPWVENSLPPGPGNVSLLSVRGDCVLADVTANVTVKDGYLRAANMLAGDYELTFGEVVPQHVNIRVTKGVAQGRFLHGKSRRLEMRDYTGLQINSVIKAAEEITIQLNGASKFARVHLFATRFLPEAMDLRDYALPEDLSPMEGTQGIPRSTFVSGRLLGEEYRYVLERAGMKKFPTLLLPKPSLLLNPWAIRDTNTSVQEALDGERFGRGATPEAAGVNAPVPARKPGAKRMERSEDELGRTRTGKPGEVTLATWVATRQFLAQPCLARYNLVPDAEGRIHLPIKDLEGRPYLRIVAADVSGALQRDVSFSETPAPRQDLTLTKALPADGHFTRQNEVSILTKDQPFVLQDGSRAEFLHHGSLADVWQLLASRSGEPTGNLNAFRWLLEWPALEDAAKKQLYSENACHEVHFFLQHKDPAFFEAVIKPFLANKHAKTFLDHYLLGNDLRPYLDAWKYQRLNTLEKILLAQRLPEQAANIRRAIADQAELAIPNPEEAERKFEGGLAGKDLEEVAETTASRRFFGMSGGGGDGAAVASVPMVAPAPVAAFDFEQESVGGARRASDKDAQVNRSLATGGAKLYFQEKLDKVKENRLGDLMDGLADGRARKEELKAAAAPLWRQSDVTKEWAENNYYKLRQGEQDADLVTPNRFWADFAAWSGKGPFLSTHVTELGHGFTESLLALAILDLPFPSQAKEPKFEIKDGGLLVTSSYASILLHREIKPGAIDPTAAKLLVSQNFYRQGERSITVNGQQEDKFIKEEFLPGVVYGCEVVVTNPTSRPLQVNLLAQIPQGAIAMDTSKPMNSLPVNAAPYQTVTLGYSFYFPNTGKFPQMPVQVGSGGKVLASAEPMTFTVVAKSTKFDAASWEYVSQRGTLEQVEEYLTKNNPYRVDLSMLAWRCQEKAGYEKISRLLADQHLYVPDVAAYALKHGDTAGIRQWLLHQDGFMQECGPALQTSLVTMDPTERVTYEHLEYSPLINARAHMLGKTRTILNEVFHEHYHEFLSVLAHEAAPTPSQKLAATQYLLTQDRIEEALAMFAAATNNAKFPPTELLQVDYLQAWLALVQENPAEARQIASKHAQHPVLRWREKFANILAQLDELEGKAAPDKAGTPDREATQNALAAKEPTLDVKITDQEIRLGYRNLEQVTVQYYPMDLEFLFSSAPFVSRDTQRFSLVQPAKSEVMALPAGAAEHRFPMPQEFAAKNVLVEILGGGKSASQTYYANELDVTVSENYGQLQVRLKTDKTPLSKAYVKVFAEINGQPKFYKDGYTDFRGKFDYASLSTDQIGGVSRFSVLIMSEGHGAVVREVKPPQR